MDKEAIQVSRMHKVNTESKIKAFVDLAIGDFVVKGFRVLDGKNGLFVGMPQELGKDGKWYNSFCPATKEAGTRLSEIVLAAYQE